MPAGWRRSSSLKSKSARIMTTIRKYPDAEAVSTAAAEEFVRLSRTAISSRGLFGVALSGGSTPRRMYEILAAAPMRDQVDWPSVHFFWGDERCVPPEHHDSNYRMAKQAMLDPLGISPGNIHRMEAE